MSEKRGMEEVSESKASQDPRDTVKARLLEVQSRSEHYQARRYTDSQRRHPVPPLSSSGVHMNVATASPQGGIPRRCLGRRDEWTTYLTLDTYDDTEIQDHLRGASPKVTEPQ